MLLQQGYLPLNAAARSTLKRSLLPSLLIVSWLAWNSAAAQTGFIEILAEPGIEVYVDDVLVGVTRLEAGGLVVFGVLEGRRQLLVQRAGGLPQRSEIDVVAGEVASVVVGALKPLAGSLVFDCVRADCVVDFPTVGLRKRVRRDDPLLVSGVPLGLHTGTVRRLGRFSRRVPVSLELCQHGDTVQVQARLDGRRPSVRTTSAFGFGSACAPPPQPDSGRLAAGEAYSLVVLPDGSLWAWGRNSAGELGDGTAVSRSLPRPLLTDVRTITVGWQRSFAIRNDGTLWAWGDNRGGQLGDRSLTTRFTPVRVLTGVRSVAAGVEHTLAVRDNGTLWAWGDARLARAADGGAVDRHTPSQVLAGVRSVAAGAHHSLALLEDGSVWAWGENASGQLGDGTTTNRSAPVPVLDGVRSVAAGWRHSLAVRDDGTLWAWGWNAFGQLGDGTTTSRMQPLQVLSGVRSVAAGGSHSLAVLEDGGLVVWGWNAYGQLGDGTTSNRLTPTRVLTGVQSIAAGGSHSMALREDETLWAWGRNGDGELGASLSAARSQPIKVMGPISPPLAPSAWQSEPATEPTRGRAPSQLAGIAQDAAKREIRITNGIDGPEAVPIPVPNASVKVLAKPQPPVDPSSSNDPATDSGAERARPFAVLIDNTGIRPLGGVQEASVILEMPVEWGVTRLMFLYNREDPSVAGPVRSARDYFLAVANRASAVLVHIGGSPSAYQMIRSADAPPTIDLIRGEWDSLYSRVGLGAPFNVYLLEPAKVRQAVDAMDATPSDNPGASMRISLASEGRRVQRLQTDFGFANSTFAHDAVSNRYVWLRNGEPSFDSSGEPVRVDAVIVGALDVTISDEVGRLAINLDAGGAATLYADGGAIDGRWALHPATGIGFAQADGVSVDLSGSRVWIALSPNYALRLEVP
jgi:alpha-tubulin suppressor-like RCC1 family protein